MLVTVLNSNDLVVLSCAQVALEAEGMEVFLLDAHTASAEGSLGILPRRLAVHAQDAPAARAVLEALDLR